MASANDINFAFSVWQVSKYECISISIRISVYIFVIGLQIIIVMKFYILTKSSDMLNKNTLGVKKVRGQEEAAF